ncbi:hypothetical protein ACIQRF_22365 [Streptomyces avermitilis]|nr:MULTISPECIES: hypothetical protein [Streptomyces]MYT00049.1 hypothetical protein [Streptomyces sp. SID5469]BBJ52478.1 hypothetical protein SAVMC3_51070 [Streptomyces avermitilis]
MRERDPVPAEIQGAVGPLTAHDVYDVTEVADEAAHVPVIRGAMPARDDIGRL